MFLKLVMVLLCAVWVSLWVLKPTQVWTRKWKQAEESAASTVFGYNGLDFAVYTFPLIAFAIIGSIYLGLKQKEPRSSCCRITLHPLSGMDFLHPHLQRFQKNNANQELEIEQVAVQSFKGVNPVRFAGRSMRSAASSADLEGFGHISGTFLVWGVKHQIPDEVIPSPSRMSSTSTWFSLGFFLFALDKLLRIVQSRPETCLVSARVFPCKAIELVLPKDPRLKYAPTSVIFMKMPSISKLQWHSFSISSSSSVDEHTLSVIIKCEGGWTNSLYNIVKTELGSDADQMKRVPVAIEGPYGPASLDFLSILQEINFALSSGKKRLPAQIQLIYVVKKSQDVCLLDSVLPVLLNQRAEQLHLKLKVFVTREQSGAPIRELLMNEFSKVETVNFGTQCSGYAIHGLENLLSAIMCGTIVAVYLRWRKLKKELPPSPQKYVKEVKPISVETSCGLEEHEIHFGRRPNFQGIFSKFPNETGGSDIGVLVCGPEAMKESVASLCQMNAQGIRMGAQRKKPYFSFHSLNFSL
ncbi:ferric reduction oxidase 8 [Actinidia rufa]|uniref:Ferric reduction oxidase 8 n=1 Tax=Actinidia rufa TaxID=165716 RepID=A0A7J0H2T8_9ERIC|nr:ferric reduction oxidase 8 [Actinidia rufa]